MKAKFAFKVGCGLLTDSLEAEGHPAFSFGNSNSFPKEPRGTHFPV